MLKGEKDATSQKEQIKSSKIKNIIWSMKIYLVVENWFGIFRIYHMNGQLLQPKKSMKILSAVIPSAHVVLFAAFFGDFSMYAQSLMDVVIKIPHCLILVQYVIYALASSSCLSKNFKHLINSFADLDSMLTTNTDDSFYKKSRYESKKYILMLCTLHAMDSLLDFFINKDYKMSTFISLPIYFLENFEILVFCNFILLLQQRLEIINGYLATFVGDKECGNIFVVAMKDRRVKPQEKFHYIGQPSNENMKIRDLATIYDKIGDICYLINESFNLHLLMTLIVTFTYVLIAICTALYYYRTPEYGSSLFMSLITWCITIMFTVVMMSITCERLLLTRNCTKILVNKVIMDYDITNIMRVQAKAFMELIEAWPLQISVYDMFNVDINLTLKFTSVATTYLIVIIQLSHFI